MLKFTESAKVKVLSFINQSGKTGQVLRVAVTGKHLGAFTYGFYLDEEAKRREDDQDFSLGEFTVFVDKDSTAHLQDATVDWVDSVQGAGFQVTNPNSASPRWDDPKMQKIQVLIDEEINPSVASHGGFVELVDLKEDKIFLKLGGGCHGCSSASATLKQGIEVRMKEMFPEITQIVDVTDHATGENPYFHE